MAATELGYVGFAADIYSTEYDQPIPDFDTRAELATAYRADPALFTGRIQAAVNVVKAMDEVDETKVAIAGYCFGGSGVLQYALLAINDVNAIVSFHGGLSSVLSLPEPDMTVTPQVLVLSGGSDDTSTDIVDLENTMNEAGAPWEITRYSDIEHGFTNFHDGRYNEWADMRSWMSMAHMLKKAFGEITFDGEPPESIDGVQAVPYVDPYDDKDLQGYLALPDPSIWKTPAPGVVVLP